MVAGACAHVWSVTLSRDKAYTSRSGHGGGHGRRGRRRGSAKSHVRHVPCHAARGTHGRPRTWCLPDKARVCARARAGTGERARGPPAQSPVCLAHAGPPPVCLAHAGASVPAQALHRALTRRALASRAHASRLLSTSPDHAPNLWCPALLPLDAGANRVHPRTQMPP